MTDRATTVPRLHVITPDRLDAATTAVTAALLAQGAPLVQIRLKHAGDRQVLAAVRDAVRSRRDDHQVVVVDDRVDVAIAAGASGVHVGADDLPVEDVRDLVPAGMLVGATARDPEAARVVAAAGADYLGVGPVFRSQTKTAGLPDPIGLAGLAAVARAVTIPVIAIAGIEVAHTPDLLEAGAHGVAVSAAVYGHDDPVTALRSFEDALAVHAAAATDAGALP